MSKNILVTGGAGYIGPHTCQLLAQQGFTPIVLDSLISGHREFVKWGPLVEGDIADSELVAKTIKEYKIDAAIHFASFINVGESVANPAKYFHNNVTKTLSFLDSLVAGSVKNLVFSSTCAIYGPPKTTPINESFPHNPISPYGDAKLMVEKILASYFKAYGLKSISLRYFNAAGASPLGDIGEDHSPESHLIPLCFKAITDENFSLTIFGEDYNTPDGTCLRDYIHVDDLAAGHILAIDKLLKNEIAFDAFNIGLGKAFSVREIIQCASKVSGRPVKYKMGPRREGDPDILLADNSKIKAALGFAPKVTAIETIMQDAWNWYQKRF